MAFTGKATYSAFTPEIAVDMSPLIALAAPVVTPVLDFIGDAQNPVAARSTQHSWMDDEYAPGGIIGTLIISTGLTSVAAASEEGVRVDGWAGRVQVGDVFQLGTVDDAAEHVQVNCIPGGGGSGSANSLRLVRGVFGTSVRSATAGFSLIPIANAALEGQARNPNISTVRVQRNNWVQPIVKPVEVSLTMEAVDLEGNISSEFEYQTRMRTREALRDLENAVLRGTSDQTTGNGTVYRTIRGMWSWITNTHTVSQNLLDTDFIDDAIESGWLLGRNSGYNLMIVGVTAQKFLDRLPDVQRQAMQDERNITRVVRTYESGLSDGPIRIVVTPNLDPRAFMITHTDDLAVLPLQRRSFQFYNYALTKQAREGELAGEYTLEFRRYQTAIRGYITT